MAFRDSSFAFNAKKKIRKNYSNIDTFKNKIAKLIYLLTIVFTSTNE